MSRKYKFADSQKLYFVTFTVLHWIDFFIREEYREIFIDSVKHCQVHKGLEVYAWCIMPSHIHLIIGSAGKNPLEGIVRDLKSFTSRSYRKVLEGNGQVNESRKYWLLKMMYKAGKENSNNNDYQFWEQHNHPIELNSADQMDRILEYIHLNPVHAGFVDQPEHWLYSSARDYGTGIKGFIDLNFIE